MKGFFKKSIFFFGLMTSVLLVDLILFSGCFASKVIVFSGASTSGKTRTCCELMKRLPNAIDVHFDDYFLDVVAQNYPQNQPVAHNLYDFVRKTSEKVREKIKKNLGVYDYIICDTCVIDLADMDASRIACQGHEVYFVLVYCPFAELAKRVSKRNELALQNKTPQEFRYLESVLWEFSNTYRGACIVKNLSADRFNQQDSNDFRLTRKTVCEIVPKQFSNDWLDILLDGKTLEQELLEKMSLLNEEVVSVVPKLHFDLVVDNGACGTPECCAKTIENFLIQRSRDKPKGKASELFATRSFCFLDDFFVPVSRLPVFVWEKWWQK